MADDEPAALDDDTDGARTELEDEWPQLSPLELGVCLADGQTRQPERPVDRTTSVT